MADIQSNIKFNIDTSDAMASIKALQSQISAFQTQMAKGSSANAREARNLQRTLIDNVNATNKFAASVTTVRTTTESFTSALEKNKLSMRDYFRYAGGASKSFGRFFAKEFETINKVARERVKDLQTQYIQLGRDANGAMQAIKIRPLILDMNNLATTTAIVAQRQQLLNQLLKQGSTNLLNFGKNTQWAGRQLMVGFTIPLGILGQTAVKTFMDMEQQAIKFKRVYGDLFTNTEETAKALKNIRDLASEFTKYGVAASKTMELAAQAAATGKTGAELLAQVNQANRLAVLGNVEQQQALETTMSLTNAFGVAADKLSEKINFLNAVENQTVTSIEDLTTAIPKAGPVIQQLGGDVEDLAFFLTAMREGGINASEGANALKSGLASLINPTQKASDMLSGFGINIKRIVEANKGNIRGLVTDFAEALNTLDPLNRARAIEQLFGKFQFSRLSTLFQNVVREGTQAARVLELTAASSSELAGLANRELSKLAESPMYKFQKAVEDIKVQLAPVGEEFLKAITPIIEFGTNVLKAFNNLDGGVKQFIVNLTGIVGGIGPILLMTFGLLANGAANIIKLFALMKSGFNNLGQTSNDLASQTQYLTTEQIQASSVAASLDQVHSKLRQTFTLEKDAVDQLTAAYQRNIAASGMTPIVGPRMRKYANGGMIMGPGTGTSDSIPAMVSNGEYITNAKQTKKYFPLLQAISKDQVPGFKSPDGGNLIGGGSSNVFQGRQMVLPGGPQLGHFSIPSTMSAGDLIKLAQEQGATQAEINDIILSVSGDLTKTLKVFDNQVERVSDELNQGIGDVGSGKTVSKGLAYRDLVTRGRDARSPIIDRMIKNGVVPEQALASADRITQEVKNRLDKLGEGVRLTAEDINRITSESYEAVAKADANIKTAFEQQKKISNYKDEGGARGAKGQREGFGKFSFIKQRPRLARTLARIDSPSAYGASVFRTTKEMEEISGLTSKEIQQRFKMLSNEQKIRVHAALKNGTESFIVSLFRETENAVVEGVKKSTRQKSPSKDAFDVGANIGTGGIQGIKSTVDDAKTAGQQIGRAATDGIIVGGQSGTARRATLPQQPFIPLVTQSSNDNIILGGGIGGEQVPGTKTTNKSKISLLNKLKSGKINIGPALTKGGFGLGTGLALASMVAPPQIQGALGNASMIATFVGMFGNAIGKAIPVLSKFIGPLGIVVTGFGVLSSILGEMDKAAQERIKNDKALYNATKTNVKGLESAANFFGTTLKDLPGSKARISSYIGASRLSAAEQLLQDPNFKKDNATQIDAIKRLSKTDAEFALTSMAASFASVGFGEDAVQTMVDAIVLAAGRKDLKIDFKSINVGTKEGRAGQAKVVEDFISQQIKEFENIGGKLKTPTPGTGAWRQLQIDRANIATETATALSPQFTALQEAYMDGTINLEQYNKQFDILIKAMTAFPDITTRFSVMQGIIANINPEIAKLTTGVKNTKDQALLLQAVLLGLEINPETIAALSLPDAAGGALAAFGLGGGIPKTLSGMTKSQAEKDLNEKIENKKKLEEKIKKLLGIDDSSTDAKTILNDKLKLIADKEDKINDAYDRRKKALEQINRLQEQITQQQKSQLDLADAISRGDVSAANKIALEMSQANAANQLEAQGNALESQRERALAAIRVGGLSRAEIESALAGKATGGYISGPGTGTSDSIPALLSNGEYVIRAKAAKAIGIDTLNKLNHAEKFADGGPVDPNNPISILGTGLNKVINGIYENLFGKWAVNLRKGKITAPSLSDAETMAFNALPIPGKFGKLGKFFGKSSKANNPKTSLVKSLITGNLMHGSTGTTAKSFKINPFGGGQSNAFGANLFATNDKELVKFYGNLYKIKMPLSQALSMKILDLAPGAKSIEQQFPGLSSKLGVNSEQSFLSYAHNRNFAEIAKSFGIGAIRHQEDTLKDVFAFINPQNTKAIRKLNIFDMLGKLFKKPTTPSKLPTRSAMANGGMVGIPHFSNGGMFRTSYGSGGLAMLHDKEFVMKKSAVDRIGINNLTRANNNSTNRLGDSMYNSYSINLNVSSNSDANDIANKVIDAIRRVESQNIRSNRF